MKAEELKSKKVCLYPKNQQADLIWNMQKQMPFDIIHIFTSTDTVKEELDAEQMEQADVLLILESNPVTLLLKPYSQETLCYLKLIEQAKLANKPVIYTDISDKLIDDFQEKGIRIEKLDYEKNAVKYSDKTKEDPLIVVSSINVKQNLPETIKMLQDILWKNEKNCYLISSKVCSFFLSMLEGKRFERIDRNGEAVIAILEGLSQSYSIYTNCNLASEEKNTFRNMIDLKPDMVLLTVDGSDSYEMILDTMKWYQEQNIDVKGLILNHAIDCWQEVYFEEKAGVPVLSSEKKEFEYQFLSLVLNCFCGVGNNLS